ELRKKDVVIAFLFQGIEPFKNRAESVPVTVRREPHDLVFIEKPEPQIGCNGQIEKPESLCDRIYSSLIVSKLIEPMLFSFTNAAGKPCPHTIKRHNQTLREAGRKEGAGGVSVMMIDNLKPTRIHTITKLSFQ